MTNAKKTDMNLKIDAEVAATMVTAVAQCAVVSLTTSSVIQNNVGNRLISPKKSRRAEDGWKEVTRKYSIFILLFSYCYLCLNVEEVTVTAPCV